jgi:hypothetical protein
VRWHHGRVTGDAAVLPRTLALGGIVATLASMIMIGALHVVPPSADVDPVRRTISQYALLETGPVFNVAVLALAAGSVATLLALIVTGLLPARSGGALALLLWSAGLAAVVYFPKHNWAVGPSFDGTIHRFASVVAFLSMPVAALLVGRRWRGHRRWGGYARTTQALGVLALLCLAPIVVAVAAEPFTGVRWWRAIPLGAVERALASAEVATLLTLAWWAVRAARREPVAAIASAPAASRR